MSERLVVDSRMTADGEVVPLGPVDKDGHRVPLYRHADWNHRDVDLSIRDNPTGRDLLG